MAYVDPDMVFQFNASDQSFRIEDRGGYMTRNRNTTKLLTHAMKSLQGSPGLTRDLNIPIYTGDFSPERGAGIYFAYAGDGANPHEILIPDFTFCGWDECGWPDYEATASVMVEAGRQTPQDLRLFWIGNTTMHWSRHHFVYDVAPREPRVLASSLVWIWQTARPGVMHDVPAGSHYVSLPDHCRYRYLLDLQGMGYSGRLKMLLFSGRPVFIQDRRWVEYWHRDLVPFVHFVPVREGLDNLSERLDWAEAHPDEVAEIGRRGRLFAEENLHYGHALDRMSQCLITAAERGSLTHTA